MVKCVTDFCRDGYFLASENVLREICTTEEFERIKKASVPYEGEGCRDDMCDSDSSDSYTDSSHLALRSDEPAAVGGGGDKPIRDGA